MEEPTVFGIAVNEFYNKLAAMTASPGAECDASRPAIAAMMCDAAVQAIGKFLAANPKES